MYRLWYDNGGRLEATVIKNISCYTVVSKAFVDENKVLVYDTKEVKSLGALADEVSCIIQNGAKYGVPIIYLYFKDRDTMLAYHLKKTSYSNIVNNAIILESILRCLKIWFPVKNHSTINDWMVQYLNTCKERRESKWKYPQKKHTILKQQRFNSMSEYNNRVKIVSVANIADVSNDRMFTRFMT